ncbi:sensor histidine kinase [Mucilaginibacter sp. SP1R1]|uniref:sensor histidine kinase n=1 Tax=Mucilaginibacter sp. SP1R1 TaxID=2723091 RepID=UPI00161D1C41|nr:sensor histidine kinase [Mucilaginibacter sp. SP1R1]MBB6148151.1 sensor histidine kinase YesM [Mucilaginibacter sp. SP1R1]
MKIWRYRPNIVQLQVLIWVAVLLLIFFSLLPMDGFRKSVIYTIVNTTSYAIIIYGNILILYPLFYQKGRFVWYGLLVMLLLVATGILRGYTTIMLYQHFLQLKAVPIKFLNLLNYVPGGILIYILSLVFRISIVYFTLKQQTEEIMLQKSQAELNLLKSQVQPHFLFNTLNNIYYKVYKVDPEAAGLIERLSDIMRYFVDESPKDEVPVNTEVAFIENYIALEKIRIRHGATVNFEKAYHPELRIPPMLLMTFVENIFKHGIDKSRKQNQVNISLIQKEDYLLFKTINRKVTPVVTQQSNGFGIANLTKRLTMLYGSKFELAIDNEGELYTAFLKIPLS